MRQPIVAGNWKMHGQRESVVSLLDAIVNLHSKAPDVEFVVFPPFVYLDVASVRLSDTPIKLGAQNMSDKLEGAMTGEISASMLLDVNCQYVILGHSERRQFLEETNLHIARKVQTALSMGLTPILCVGETLEDRESGKTIEVVHEQLAHVLSLKDNLPSLSSVVIAYEPIWAIGTGKTATPKEADVVHAAIRQCCDSALSGWGSEVRILYGGSVKPQNARDLFAMPNIDGALVGGASLDAEQFIEIGKQWNRS